VKYKGTAKKKEQRDLTWLLQVVAGIFLIGLPFVVSFVGWDTFRFPKYCVVTLAVGVLIAGLVALRRMSLRFPVSRWEWLLSGGVLYAGLHTLFSSSPELSWTGFKSLFLFALLFLLLRAISTRKFQELIWFGIAAALGVNGILTVLQYYGLLDLMRSATGSVIRGRINPAGFIGEVNSGGFLFGLAVIILIYFVVTEKRPLMRLTACALMGMNLVALAYTRTITASVALLVCALLWLLFHHWWVLRGGSGVSRELTRFWLLLAFFALGSLGVAYQAGLVQRVVMVGKAFEQGEWTHATAGRIPVFMLTWEMIREQPWLGRGLNTYGKDFFHFRVGTEAGRKARLLHQPGAFREAHNEYLQVWEELGIPGIVILLALIGGLLWRSLVSIRSETDPRRSYWLGMLSIGIVYVAIGCLAFFPLHLALTGAYTILLCVALRENQEGEVGDSRGDSWQRSRIVLPILLGILLVLAGGFVLQAIDGWRANREAGIAEFLVRSASGRDYRAAQRRAIADEALARMEKAQDLAPDLYELHSLKGSVLMLLGRYELAADSYSKGLEYFPSAELYTNLATAFLALGQNEKASECLEFALAYAPRYGKARQAREFLRRGE
jgi:O-antigen ligase